MRAFYNTVLLGWDVPPVPGMAAARAGIIGAAVCGGLGSAGLNPNTSMVSGSFLLSFRP